MQYTIVASVIVLSLMVFGGVGLLVAQCVLDSCKTPAAQLGIAFSSVGGTLLSILIIWGMCQRTNCRIHENGSQPVLTVEAYQGLNYSTI